MEGVRYVRLFFLCFYCANFFQLILEGNLLSAIVISLHLTDDSCFPEWSGGRDCEVGQTIMSPLSSEQSSV